VAQKKLKQSREKMIEAATRLFHMHGIKGTSIDQILLHSGTGKSQFTHYFKNKEGLVRAVIDTLYGVIREGRAPTGYDVRSWEDFEDWFGKYISFQKEHNCELSCPLGTIGGELGKEDELLRSEVKLFFEWCASQLARFFAERKAAGELKEDADPDGLADLCIAVMEGGMLMSKIKRDTLIFERAAGEVMEYINLLREV
jgi:TetR/AcrR family transcriptional regulator, transcriptional repressor for nem operon